MRDPDMIEGRPGQGGDPQNVQQLIQHEPRPNSSFPQANQTDRRLRLRNLARQVWTMGPRGLAEMLSELDAGDDPHAVLARYGEISRVASRGSAR